MGAKCFYWVSACREQTGWWWLCRNNTEHLYQNDIVTLYKTEMEKVFGDGACDVLKIPQI